jgi:hypothetical protein
MKPKSETMWMAWHPLNGFYPKTFGRNKLQTQKYVKQILPECWGEFEYLKVQITEITKKRGREANDSQI